MISETTYSQEEIAYRQARKHVYKLKGFYSHLTSFVIINAGLVVLNLLTSPQYLWFFWPLLGWGIGIVFHAASVFNWLRLFPKAWEERKIREHMEKARREGY